MLDAKLKESTLQVAQIMLILSQRLTDVTTSDDEDALRRELTKTAEALQQAGTVLELGLHGGEIRSV